jgi:hypothetical protein
VVTGRVGVTGRRVEDEHGVAPGGVELAMRLVGDLDRADGAARLQTQRVVLVE